MRFSAMRWMVTIMLVGPVLTGTGCSTTTSDKILVPITVTDAQQVVQGKKRLLGLAGTEAGAWVDCRSEADFRAGHIPGAISLPFERVTRDHKELNIYDVIVIYGNDYNDDRAKGMSKRLKDLGHSDVRTLIGGMRAWKADGNAIETGEGGTVAAGAVK